ANARGALPHGGRPTIATASVELTEADAAKHPYTVIPGLYARLLVAGLGKGELRAFLTVSEYRADLLSDMTPPGCGFVRAICRPGIEHPGQGVSIPQGAVGTRLRRTFRVGSGFRQGRHRVASLMVVS